MHEISIKAEELFHIGNFPVTNSLLLSFLTLLLLVIVAAFVWKKISLVPSRMQNLFELIVEQMLQLMDTVLGDREKSVRYFPLVATIFFFVMISNWLGLFPFVGSIGLFDEHGHGFIPLFRAPAADLNFTVALGVIAIFGANILGLMAIGARRYMSRYFTLSSPISTFTGILEFVSEFVKIISFSFRLFGNVFAGEVLLLIVGFLVPLILPLPFLFLEVFVGFIQAFIFAMLTLVFVAMATTEESAH